MWRNPEKSSKLVTILSGSHPPFSTTAGPHWIPPINAECLEDIEILSRQFPSAEFAEPRLRTRFQKPKLRFAQIHFRADLFLGLLFEVKARQYLPIAP